jgi:hypothetical protein
MPIQSAVVCGGLLHRFAGSDDLTVLLLLNTDQINPQIIKNVHMIKFFAKVKQIF